MSKLTYRTLLNYQNWSAVNLVSTKENILFLLFSARNLIKDHDEVRQDDDYWI